MKDLYQYIKPKNSFSMVMVGDILAHVEVYNDAKRKSDYDFKPMFSYIKPIIKQHDIAFCNQESILGGEKLGLHGGEYKKIGIESNPVFNSPYELGDAVVDCGFNLISLANNHTLDNGEEGVRNSLEFWRQQFRRAYTSGSWNNDIDRSFIKIQSCNGIRFAFIAYTAKTNTITPPIGKEYLTNIYSSEKAKKDIYSIRDKVDMIIVSMHWGTEYNLGKIDNNQKEMAEYLSSLGVNIIIGHHPHVIEPIEFINDTLVIYSLGNALARQDGDDLMKRIGAMVTVDIDNSQEKLNIKLENVDLTYIYYTNDYKDFKIIPFSKLTDNELPDYKKIENKYMKYIKK